MRAIQPLVLCLILLGGFAVQKVNSQDKKADDEEEEETTTFLGRIFGDDGIFGGGGGGEGGGGGGIFGGGGILGGVEILGGDGDGEGDGGGSGILSQIPLGNTLDFVTEAYEEVAALTSEAYEEITTLTSFAAGLEGGTTNNDGDVGDDGDGDGATTGTSETEEETAIGDVAFLTCTKSDICYSDSTQTPGAWTCRPQPIGSISLCVPTLLGLTLGREGDSCGCCNGVCPKKCQCKCQTISGADGYMARFSLFFGLVQFDQCLEPTVADAATSFSTLDISCSDACMNDDGTIDQQQQQRSSSLPTDVADLP